ncbi:Hypothetical protein, putative [Bodo saltans]|uniref:Uncharacterized protein n=1 Tax=Bodo saltans TaxID=75058 RepID=A0A0S4J418_BODSA|nr:Hypothetical protein, putative [Bodo saltans]|eukprot:CUG75007.1 Hypothetical protein, putative [Bodo saltans]
MSHQLHEQLVEVHRATKDVAKQLAAMASETESLHSAQPMHSSQVRGSAREPRPTLTLLLVSPDNNITLSDSAAFCNDLVKYIAHSKADIAVVNTIGDAPPEYLRELFYGAGYGMAFSKMETKAELCDWRHRDKRHANLIAFKRDVFRRVDDLWERVEVADGTGDEEVLPLINFPKVTLVERSTGKELTVFAVHVKSRNKNTKDFNFHRLMYEDFVESCLVQLPNGVGADNYVAAGCWNFHQIRGAIPEFKVDIEATAAALLPGKYYSLGAYSSRNLVSSKRLSEVDSADYGGLERVMVNNNFVMKLTINLNEMR